MTTASRSILLIEDEPQIRRVLRTLLELQQFRVVEAEDAARGLSYARSHKPDLIFLDIVMLGMDGFAVMRELQKDPATKDIPVVFVSSKSQKADQAWARMQGAKGFVPKPISEQAILEEIRKL
jgi:twitching motility two-component system response regulator PilH